ncbi:hypothetical protein [Egicoccus halophilus]|uniref:hypothetical protein n=1 Tax=Egicoccus halophilus TaxID=1670830 RepID=UPI00102FB33B|nr:hypothetical protein [Egicoccus halophilus]
MTTLPASLPAFSAGHGRRRGASPFGAAAPSIVLALGYLLALLVWLAFGDALPGGRWFSVHLFTLGVLTNLVLTFSEHFGRTVTRTVGERPAWWPLITNAGILGVLVGLPSGRRWLLVAGATTLTVSVFVAYWRIRRMRHAAVGARFGWIARVYERAHGAFIHGAILGALLGSGVLTGRWYGAGRIAHLHANILGWGGLTLLATLVFFGPTMARTRIEEGADARAARWLRPGATGLSAAVLLLLLTGLVGWGGTAARLASAAAVAVYALAATVVCVPVARAVARAPRRTAAQPLVWSVAVAFPLVAWVDAAVLATGTWRWLDAVGAAALTAVLAQAVIATLVYLAPMLRGRSTGAREVITRRLEVGARTRAAVLALGATAVTVAAARVAVGLPLVALGWTLLAATVVATLATALWPIRSPGGIPQPGSAVRGDGR